MKTILRFFFKLTGIPTFFLFARPRYYLEDGKKHSRALKGGAIVIANHTNIMDFFMMVFAHPFRKQRILVSEAIYKHPFLGFMCKVMDCILVHRERSDVSFYAEAEKTLKKGGIVMIFPEGHLVKNGKLDTFKPFVAYLALRTGAPIVPHYIDAHYCSFKRTRVIMGKPIYIKDYLKNEIASSDEIKQFLETLRHKMLELKRKMSLYQKYHTRDLIYFKSWFLELTKVLLFIPNKIIFPTKFHYLDGSSRKDRKIKGKGLIVSKHRGFADAPILAMHYISRRVHIIVGKEIYDTMPFILKHLLSIKYDRNTASNDPSCFLEIINTLRAEGVVGIYPEGHIKKDEEGEIHDGAVYFALMSGAPIYFYYMAKPYKPFRFNHVLISKTIHLEDYFDASSFKDKENIHKLTIIIEERFHHLKEESERILSKKSSL